MVSRTRCLVIAEAGVNHNGSLETARRLVDAAADTGADAVKFQTFTAAALVGRGVGKAAYQEKGAPAGDQYSMLQSLELGREEHEALRAHCAGRGIEFMSTPFDEAALELLLALGVRRIKVASGELTNKPFLQKVAATGLPMIVSTGMASLAEIGEALEWISAARRAAADRDLTLLHCTSNYPTSPDDVNLFALQTLARHFGVPVGYSDHTAGIVIAPAAVALGATVIEKHFTIDRRMPGPDHAASLEPAELRAMIAAIREVESALGDGVKEPRPSEIAVRRQVRRSVAALVELPAGHELRRRDLTVLRPETGIAPKDLDAVIGRRLARAVKAGEVLKPTDLV